MLKAIRKIISIWPSIALIVFGYAIGSAESIADIYQILAYILLFCVTFYIGTTAVELFEKRNVNKIIAEQEKQWSDLVLEDGTAIKMGANEAFDNQWHMEDRLNQQVRLLAFQISMAHDIPPEQALPIAEKMFADHYRHISERNGGM